MTDIAFSLLTPVVLGFFIGSYLDRHSAGNFPLWTIILTMIGAITGFWSVYKRQMK